MCLEFLLIKFPKSNAVETGYVNKKNIFSIFTTTDICKCAISFTFGFAAHSQLSRRRRRLQYACTFLILALFFSRLSLSRRHTWRNVSYERLSLLNFWIKSLSHFAACSKMVKILGIDDNSEMFSLFITFCFACGLFMGTSILYIKVMNEKEQEEVSWAWKKFRSQSVKSRSLFLSHRMQQKRKSAGRKLAIIRRTSECS
jgi:hypothetical protein